MALTWVLLFPLGAAAIRLFGGMLPNPVLWHRSIQVFNTLLAIVGMALGMYTSGINRTVREPLLFFPSNCDFWKTLYLQP
jgi:hypothetical protein